MTILTDLTNFQTINDKHGNPEFAIVPLEPYKQLLLDFIHRTGVPSDVVDIMVNRDVSVIRAWREYKGLTQEEVARRMDISQAALSQIEAPNAKPRKATKAKLASVLGLSIKQL
jgi:DNA-binding XRE family transcriptional regulator